MRWTIIQITATMRIGKNVQRIAPTETPVKYHQ